MSKLITSDEVNRQIDDLLLTGQARIASEAEQMFLEAHLPELVQLVRELGEDELARHEAIKLLMSHGSRRYEDAVP